MRLRVLVPVAFIFALLGCGEVTSAFPRTMRNQILPNGNHIILVDVNFLFSGRNTGNDSFSIQYIENNQNSDAQTKLEEAKEVFELIRPTSELWGLNEAEIMAFPNLKIRNKAITYRFKRTNDGKWSVERSNATIQTF